MDLRLEREAVSPAFVDDGNDVLGASVFDNVSSAEAGEYAASNEFIH